MEIIAKEVTNQTEKVAESIREINKISTDRNVDESKINRGVEEIRNLDETQDIKHPAGGKFEINYTFSDPQIQQSLKNDMDIKVK